MFVQPLAGRRIVVTRSHEQAVNLTAMIEALGGEVVHFPVIAISAPRDSTEIVRIESALQRIAHYDWLIFTSVNGVEYFMQQLQRLQISVNEIRGAIAAVGPKTADSLLCYNLVAARPPSFYQAEGLFAAIQPQLHVGQRVLIPTSNLARDYLQLEMSRIGLHVDRIHVYENHLHNENGAELVSLLQAKQIDMITLTSASTAINLFAALDSLGVANPLSLLTGIDFVCIGQKTAEAVRELGVTQLVIAEQATTESLVERMIEINQTKKDKGKKRQGDVSLVLEQKKKLRRSCI